MRISRLILASCTLSLMLVACGSDQLSTANQPTVTLRTSTPGIVPPTYTVQHGEIVEAITLSGRVAPAMDQDVFFTRDGFLKTIHVNRGDTVISGTLLAEIDPGELSDQLTKAEEDYDRARRTLQSSREDRARSLQAAQL